MAGMQDFKFRVVWEGHFHFQRAQEMPSPVKDAATWLPYNSNAPRSPPPKVKQSLLGIRHRAPVCPTGVAAQPKFLVEKQSQSAKKMIASLDSECV